MKRAIVIAAAVVVVAVGLSVAMTGSGVLGPVKAGWSVMEECTPIVPGDTSGSVGSASLSAGRTATSRYVTDNPAVLSSDAGDWAGVVSEVSEAGLVSSVRVAGRLGFTVADRTMPPVWFDDSAGSEFVAYGSGTGQVANVYGIVTDPADGSVYVSSFGNVSGVDRYKIIKFSSTGAFILEFGAFGTGNGQFSGATSLAVSPVDGSVYASDNLNYRIQKFTNAGVYVTKWGSVGSGNGQFGSVSPSPVAVDSTGAVYVGDRGNARIQKFTSAGTYSAQVAVAGFDSSIPIYALTIDSNDILYASLVAVGASAQIGIGAVGTIRSYNTSLAVQATITPAIPSGASGIYSIAAASDGVWAHWGAASFLVKYDAAGTEIERWVSAYPVPVYITTNYGIAYDLISGNTFVLYRAPYVTDIAAYVKSFNYSPVPLSSAIERYLEACDPNLAGMTYSYTAASDPDVVFPGWQGNVWAKLKELTAAYGVEIVPVGDVITVRDVRASTFTIANNTPVRIVPTKGTGGMYVKVTAHNPVAGGGVMWDAATEGTVFSVDAAEVKKIVLATNNYPAELSQPVPTDILPIQPGQYYVVNSAGTHVAAATWLSAGGAVTAAVGESPGTIELTITGSASAGPFYLATGTASGSVGALSLSGPGLITNPTTVNVRTASDDESQEFAATIENPFISTSEQALSRGLLTAAEAAGPNVTISFDVAVSDLAGFGLTVGSIVQHEAANYRVTQIGWGNLTASITATRSTTLGESDAVWAGQTVGTRDTFWSGYSAGDRRIQPLLATR